MQAVIAQLQCITVTQAHRQSTQLCHALVRVPFSNRGIAVMTLTSWGQCLGCVTSHHEIFWYKGVADTPNPTGVFNLKCMCEIQEDK